MCKAQKNYTKLFGIDIFNYIYTILVKGTDTKSLISLIISVLNMKKLFLIATLCAFAAIAHAQSAYFVSNSNATTLDTVTNTAVKTQKLPISGYQDIVSVQVKLTNISGTTAGVVRLYGSTDGVNFVRIPTVTDAGATAIDSLTGNVNALSKVFRLPTHAYTYYQVGYTGSGTMAVKLQTFAIWRKR